MIRYIPDRSASIGQQMLGLAVLAFLIVVPRLAAQVPGDFPEIEVSVCDHPVPGYIYLSNFTQDSSVTTTPYLIVLDHQGTPVNYRKLNGTIHTDFKPQPDGSVSYYHLAETNQFSTNKYTFFFVDKTLSATGQISAVSTSSVPFLNPDWLTDVHELRMLDEGRGYLLAYRLQATNMSAIGGKAQAWAVDMAIQEVDRDGQLHWHWDSPSFFTWRNTTPDVPLTNRIVDYAHCNSIEIDHDGHLILSTRYFDEVTKINRQTGEIIWRMGGSCCSNNQFTFLHDAQPQDGGGSFTGFSHQHGARRLPNGNLLLFDNGNLKKPHESRAVEYRLDETNFTAELVWEFRHDPPVQSTEMGFAQRLDNGNTLICWGGGPDRRAITEVTPEGRVVFELLLPEGVHTYRAWKQPYKQGFALTAGGVPAGLVWEVPSSLTGQLQQTSRLEAHLSWTNSGSPIAAGGVVTTAIDHAIADHMFFRTIYY